MFKKTIIALFLVFVPFIVSAHSDDEVFGYHMFGNGMWGGGILMLAFWVIGIVLLILFVKWIADQGRRESKQDATPLDILKERYAKGEIDTREFEDKKNDYNNY